MRRALIPLAACLLTAPLSAQDLHELQDQAKKAAVARAGPSVVAIETSGGTDIIVAGPRGQKILKGVGPTSGLVVDPDGYIITSAFNFANKPSSIFVSVAGQQEKFVAKVVATDQTRMLTLLKIDAKGLSVPTAAPKDKVRIGHTSLALGRTLVQNVDQPPSVSEGIISAVDRIWGKAIQSDAKISPVNYGGPLVDLQGRVTAVLVPLSPNAEGETAGFEWYDSGIGFGVPMEDIFATLPRLKLGKDLKKGLLGVIMRSTDQYGTTPVIASVTPGSAAAEIDLKSGDEI